MTSLIGERLNNWHTRAEAIDELAIECQLLEKKTMRALAGRLKVHERTVRRWAQFDEKVAHVLREFGMRKA